VAARPDEGSSATHEEAVMSDPQAQQGNDPEGTEKPGGLGEDRTIPPHEDGLGATTTDEQSTFEPEEDEGAAPEVDER
jgi:hypothetical protein